MVTFELTQDKPVIIRSKKPANNVSGYEDLTGITLTDVIGDVDFKQKNSVTADFLMNKYTELTLMIQKEDDVTDKGTLALKNAKKAMWETKEGKSVKRMMQTKKFASSNKDRLREIRNELVGDARKLGIELDSKKAIGNLKAIENKN